MAHTVRTLARWALAIVLVSAGVSHLTWARTDFLAQVPPWFPVNAGFVVFSSGLLEIALGCALLGFPARRAQVGLAVAAFFVAVFPGNVSQFVTHTSAFGLTSDLRRGVRLVFQPALVAWALWSTSGRADRRRRHDTPSMAPMPSSAR